jgi:hypothetical protein
MMTQTTSLWNLPVWAVLTLALIAGLTLFNTVDSITKIWREPRPKPPTTTRRGLLDIVQEGEQKRNG